jgi:Mg-chelatase subunit ChlD
MSKCSDNLLMTLVVFSSFASLVLPAHSTDIESKAIGNKKHLLQGGVNQDVARQLRAQQRALGFAVETDSHGQTIVTKVYPGSSAFYRGMRLGDQLSQATTSESYGSLKSTVTIKRTGQAFTLNLETRGDYQRYLEQNPADSQAITAITASGSNRTLNGNASTSANAAPTDKAQAGLIQRSERLSASQVHQQNTQDSDRLLTATSITSERQPKPLTGNLTSTVSRQEQIQRVLKNRDLYILIDRSGSMETTDCPGASSRWQWCRDQVASLSKETETLLPAGFSLVLFNNHSKVISPAKVTAISEAFENNKPEGGTDIAGAVVRVMREYSERRSRGSALPIVIAVITDGVPNDERSLRRALIAATTDISQSNEISVVFLQVGEDNQASAYLEELDRGLTQEGARFDIAQSMIFADVKAKGLLEALITCVK